MNGPGAPRRGLEALNPEQQAAVDAWRERVLVMAPVGTGKTTVLTLRAARALEAGTPPGAVLCLSFTNKAARQMKERLAVLLGKAAREVCARTFHGLCASLLRAEAEALAIPSDFVIYDEEDSRELIGRLCRRRGLSVSGDLTDRFEFRIAQAAADARLSPYQDRPRRPPDRIFARAFDDLGLAHLAARCDARQLLRDYVHALRENHALDFTDLIVGANRLFAEHPAALARWQERFRWIQVDEIQDTSRAEYRILALLAGAHRRLSFFGDLDQTIYEWRGSAPFAILEAFRAEFAPVREIQLSRNYRSTRAILNACQSVIRHYPGAVTRQIVPQVAEDGEPLRVQRLAGVREEAAWIAETIGQLRARHGIAYRDCVVLTRTNFTARHLSAEFEGLRLPHVQVEQFKFFQREEIRNALACLRLLVNPHDSHSLLRVLRTPPKGVGDAALRHLEGEPFRAGLRLADLLDASVLETGDPFASLLDALEGGAVVVFDTETTGIDIGADEIVELAAARCGRRGILDRFHAYLRPGRPVGASSAIHGLTDDFLRDRGRDPGEVLAAFARFSEGAVLAGHNVRSFDLPVLAAARRRCGLDPGAPTAFDTLDLTRRLHLLPRYTLGQIAESLGLSARPSHHAADDVAATVELLQRLAESLQAGAPARRAAVARHAAAFSALARTVAGWAEASRRLRPAELLRRVLDESGLSAHYTRREEDRRRLVHLDELLHLFETRDDSALEPYDALWELLSLASLGSDLDRQADDQDCVRLLTVHQAKGLEFDTVFIAGALEGEFPSWRSVREGRLDEEHRLFYVAVSRAKRRLLLSYPQRDGRGRPASPSRYLSFW